MSDSKRLEQLCTACLQEGIEVQMRATGQSMQPAIGDGARIHIRAIEPADVKPGDVILYRKGQGVIAHRVVACIRRRHHLIGFTTRGDASSTRDAPVPADQVLGKVISVEGQPVKAVDIKQRLKAKWGGLRRSIKPLNFLK